MQLWDWVILVLSVGAATPILIAWWQYLKRRCPECGGSGQCQYLGTSDEGKDIWEWWNCEHCGGTGRCTADHLPAGHMSERDE